MENRESREQRERDKQNMEKKKLECRNKVTCKTWGTGVGEGRWEETKRK